MGVYLKIGYLLNLSIDSLANQVFCIDGHGSANQSIYSGGRASSPGGQTDELQKIRFDDTAAVALNTTSLTENRRHHTSSSDGDNLYVAQGRGSGGYRSAIEKLSFTSGAAMTITNNTLSAARTGLAATGTATSQVYFGGREAGGYPFTRHDTVEYIKNDDSTTATAMDSMNIPRWHHCVAGNGLDAIVCHGWDNMTDNGIDTAGAASTTYEKYRLVTYDVYELSSITVMNAIDMAPKNDVNAASGGDCVIIAGAEEPDYTVVYDTIKKIRYDDNVSTMSQSLSVACKEVMAAGDGLQVMVAGGFPFTGSATGNAINTIQQIRVDDLSAIYTASNSMTTGRAEGALSSGY